MFRRTHLAGAALVLFLAAAAAAQGQPDGGLQGATIKKDIIFATINGKPLKLDIYSPPQRRAQEAASPALIRFGPQRETPAGAAKDLFGNAYVLVYAEYLPDGDADHAFSKFPLDVQAAKAAVRYIRATAKNYGIDPDKIGVWGSGDGATIAAITAFTPDQKELNGTLGEFPDASSAVRSVCLFEGITDWRYAELYGDETVNFPKSPAYQLFGGNTKDFPEAARAASAVNYIRPTSPATLMVTLASDQQRAMHQIFAETLHKAGVPSALYEDTSTADRLDETRLNKTVVEFFEDTLRARGTPRSMTLAEEIDALSKAGLYKQARRLVDDELARIGPNNSAGPNPSPSTQWLAKLNAINQQQQTPAIKQLIEARKTTAQPAAPTRLQWTIREVLTDPERIGQYAVEATVPQRVFDMRADAMRFVETLNNLWLRGDLRGAATQASVMHDMAIRGDADPAILNQFLARYDQIKSRPSHVFPPGVQNVVYASDYGQDLYGYWMDVKAGGVMQRFRYIPPGHFTRGSARDEWGRLPGEAILEPAQVSKGFWLADSEVTQGFYEGVLGADENHAYFRVSGRGAEVRQKLPMENISYAHAVNFLAKLGIPARLPTAVEWEYACRAGSDYMYAGTGRLSDTAWFWDEKRDVNGQAPTAGAPAVSDRGDVDVRILHDLDMEKTDTLRLTHPVKTKLPNAWGLFDMQGNVWEWCSGTSADRPRDYHPVKGGSWISIPQSCRAARELWLSAEEQSWNIGMRLCIPAE